MPVTTQEFKAALGQFASGVTAVTTRDARGRPRGLTVSAFCSVSLEPPLVLVSIDSRADTCEALHASGVFGVSILAKGQQEVSQALASASPEKFDGLRLDTGESGVPLVPGAVARLECRLHAAHPAGDHTLFVGLVVKAEARRAAPLLYHAGAYRALKRPRGGAGGTAKSDQV